MCNEPEAPDNDITTNTPPERDENNVVEPQEPPNKYRTDGD